MDDVIQWYANFSAHKIDEIQISRELNNEKQAVIKYKLHDSSEEYEMRDFIIKQTQQVATIDFDNRIICVPNTLAAAKGKM